MLSTSTDYSYLLAANDSLRDNLWRVRVQPIPRHLGETKDRDCMAPQVSSVCASSVPSESVVIFHMRRSRRTSIAVVPAGCSLRPPDRQRFF
jgi:hypothetical protein